MSSSPDPRDDDSRLAETAELLETLARNLRELKTTKSASEAFEVSVTMARLSRKLAPLTDRILSESRRKLTTFTVRIFQDVADNNEKIVSVQHIDVLQGSTIGEMRRQLSLQTSFPPEFIW